MSIDPPGIIWDLSPHDVLMGRGAPNAYYRGNVSFRHLVAKYKPAYLATARHEVKQDVARRIYEEIGQRQGRFLTERKVEGAVKAPKSWVVADTAVALEKIKQALRERDGGKDVYVPDIPLLDSLPVDASVSSLPGANVRERELPRPPEALPPPRLAPGAAMASTMGAAARVPSSLIWNPGSLVSYGHTAPASLLPASPVSWHGSEEHPFRSTSTLELLIRQRNEQTARDNEQRAALLWLQEQENRRHKEQELVRALLAPLGPSLAHLPPLSMAHGLPLGSPIPLVTSTFAPGGLARASLAPVQHDQDALGPLMGQGGVLHGRNSFNDSENPTLRAPTAHANAPNVAAAALRLETTGHAATEDFNKRSVDAFDRQGPLDSNGPTAKRPRGN